MRLVPLLISSRYIASASAMLLRASPKNAPREIAGRCEDTIFIHCADAPRHRLVVEKRRPAMPPYAPPAVCSARRMLRGTSTTYPGALTDAEWAYSSTVG